MLSLYYLSHDVNNQCNWQTHHMVLLDGDLTQAGLTNHILEPCDMINWNALTHWLWWLQAPSIVEINRMCNLKLCSARFTLGICIGVQCQNAEYTIWDMAATSLSFQKNQGYTKWCLKIFGVLAGTVCSVSWLLKTLWLHYICVTGLFIGEELESQILVIQYWDLSFCICYCWLGDLTAYYLSWAEGRV